MVTMEVNAQNYYREDKMEGRRQKRICRYQMGREADAFAVLLFGLGVLILVIGLTTGLYGVGHGLIGLVASWVVAFVVRAYCGIWEYHDTVDYEPEW